ncbi:Hypothetical predicted protein [Mytilus galloprovincialis]|uniref:TATA-box-binding protein n=1 Tax=Mytilus galloprovincialis TaxID=29158 RepID=A0A8B6FJ53_MYTGA|nr:Hypothetical predicted protein [Mytilus galloprovincialis]
MGNDVRLTQVQILTASASHQLSGRVDPYRLPSEFSFEPEIFPAVMFRRHGMHFTCHLSGKIMITGLKSQRDVQEVYPVLLEMELYL